MRILQINNAEEIGGGSERVYQLTCQMLLNRGHDVATLSCGKNSFDERKHTVLLERNGYIRSNPLDTLRNIRDFIYRPQAESAIRTLVSEFRPQLAHLHIFYGQLSSAVLATLSELKIPCVMTVHEYRMLCPVSTMYTERNGVCERCAGGSPLQALTNRCNRGSFSASGLSATEVWFRDRYYPYKRLIEHFFMVSEFCLKKHVEFLPEIEAKSSVLYNFVSNPDISTRPQELTAKAPFLYCGRLSPEKGVALLCEAFAARPNLELRIAGSGPLADILKGQYERHANIKFLGKLDSSTLKLELGSSRFSIAPSEWYENNPMAILESFSVGTPVLGANIGGIPELVKHGSTGLLFQPSSLNSLVQSLDIASTMSNEDRDTMGRNAIDMINVRHSEAAYYEQLIIRYNEVLAKAPTGTLK